MAGIPSAIYNPLKQALLDCGPFESDAALRAIFVDDRLKPWRHSLPQASNPAARAEAIMAFLADKRRADTEENALVLLLRVLSERLDPTDECHLRLSALADEVEEVFGGNSSATQRIASTSKSPEQGTSIQTWTAAELHHMTGQPLNETEWATDASSQYRHLVYGPYISLSAGEYAATFQLKIRKIALTDEVVATLDIAANSGAIIVKKRQIFRREFRYPDAYEYFKVQFTLDEAAEGVEFRVLCESAEYLAVHRITLRRLDRSLAGTDTAPGDLPAKPVSGSTGTFIAAVDEKVAPAQIQPLASVTWLHLSDLHFRESRAYDENIVLKALLRDVTERIEADDLRLDFVVITGDLAFSGKPSEYALARRFFDELLAVTGLSRDHLFVIPGNHDVDRSLVTAGGKAIGSSLNDRDAVNTLLATPDDRRLVMARFKGYKEFVNDWFAERFPFDDEHYFFVHTLELAGLRIALLRLNSAWLCASDEDKAHGLVIGERQVRTALEQAQSADLKIAILHHPFDWLREFDQNDSAALLLDNCDFVLHGHLHRSAMTQLISPDSGAMVIAGGACYETRQYPNSYNFVKLDLSDGNGTVHLRRYSDERGGFWAKDTLTYRNVPDGAYSFSLSAKPVPGSAPKVSRSITPIGNSTRYMDTESAPTTPSTRNTEAIRDLLTVAFDDEGLTALCYDHFRPVYDDFSVGMSKRHKIQRLLDYCERHLQMEKLLTLIQEHNPDQYARFKELLH